VAAKRRRAAVLDRRHDIELGQTQVTGLNGTIASSFSSEDIGDLERGAQAASAAGILALHQQRQMLERTGHRADRLGRNARVEGGRIELAVAQQDLDHADICCRPDRRQRPGGPGRRLQRRAERCRHLPDKVVDQGRYFAQQMEAAGGKVGLLNRLLQLGTECAGASHHEAHC
jgi:hypothetical protein